MQSKIHKNKQQPIYIRLQNQYKKLNSRIQKSIKNGHFYQFTQFKQQQLLGRLKRYSLQLKQVAAGVAVVGALGVATPSVGQVTAYNLTERTGVANPLDGVFSAYSNRPIFVDIDNDGDQDCFVGSYTSSPAIGSNTPRYYENTGTPLSPNFVQRTGSANPLDGLVNIVEYSFVDIDNDGDLDFFAGNNYYFSNSEECFYYENTGTATAPVFVQRTGANNPLDALRADLLALSATTTLAPLPSFVDIDNDGDMDCFIGVGAHYGWTSSEDVWFYENTGTASSPTFVKQIATNNPFTSALASSALSSSIYLVKPITFLDVDADGDMDAHFSVASFFSGVGKSAPFFENTGTVSSPNFASPALSLVDSLLTVTPLPMHFFALVDIDGDSDLDVFGIEYSTNSPYRYFENLDTTITTISKIKKEETIAIYPNPTTGTLHFEKGLTGTLQLFDISGQEIWAKELFDEAIVDFSKIPNGLYFLTIENDKERIRKKVLIQK